MNRKVSSGKNNINKRNNMEQSRIDQMRERYRNLYFRSNQDKDIETKPLSQQDMELIKKVLATIQEEIEKMKTLPKEEKRKIANNILLQLKKIQGYQLPLAEVEQLYELMCSTELQRLHLSRVDSIDQVITKLKSKIAVQLISAINYEQGRVNDIEELKILSGKLTERLGRENYMAMSATKNKISFKITAVQQQQLIDKIRNDIPTEIISIVHDLTTGTIDIQRANAIIDAEAKRRLESKPKTKFSVTEEQEKNQILIQMRRAIIERANEFHIENPEKTVLLLQQLCGGERIVSIRAVVKNFIAKKDFQTARSICDEFSKGSEETEYLRQIINLRREIRNAEISDIVMTVINMKGTAEEEKKYFALIEKALRMGRVNLSSVSLGKSKDGTRNITLADIWTDEMEKRRMR